MSTDLTFVTNEPGNNLRDRADFPACPPLKFGSTILERTPSIGRTRPHPFAKKAVRMWLEQKGVRTERHVPIGGQM